MPSPRYAELLCRTAFSFGEGASTPEEIVDTAAAMGLAAVGVADRDGVYGLPRAHKAAAEAGIPLVCGARITLAEHPGLVLLVRDAQGWSNLCRLITQGRSGTPRPGLGSDNPDEPLPLEATDARKGWGRLPLEALLERPEGLDAVLVGSWDDENIHVLKQIYQDHLSIAISRRMDSADPRRLAETQARARRTGVPLLATADALMHSPDRKRLQDALTCVRLGTTLHEAGRALQPNAVRVLSDPDAMAWLFRGLEPALRRSLEIAERCTFHLGQLAYRYPREIVPEGVNPMDWLRRLTWEGLERRYPAGVPEKVAAQVVKELDLVQKLDFAAYFLTVYDAVAFAERRGILCQGRGSAANSVICYALGVTSVDPKSFNLLFERFISEERGEPPDIDVDFEHERREEVIQYIYGKYGRDRAAMVATVISWQRRSAIRELGKVMGLSLDQVDRLARLARWREPDPTETVARPEGAPETTRGVLTQDVVEAGLDPADPAVAWTVQLSGELEGLPRHMSIHVGGFTISDGPLIDLVPVEPASMEGRTILQWDKDDIDIVRFVKVDLLALGMLTAIKKTFDLLGDHPSGGPWALTSVPSDDERVYDMLGRADTVGVFQVESRAQMSMLPRLRPRSYYDLVIEISLVRPGPIQGGMVHPYLKRRLGEEPVIYAHKALRPILERTHGVPIFQEQVMAMAVAVGGFSPGEADELRRAMGAFRKRGKLGKLTDRLKASMVEHGISEEYAEQIGKQILGFGEYGFPESHAASFARLVWVSSWLRAHQPAAFCAALINSQPMGFYSPRSLVADAQRHGVEVRPVDVTRSGWDCSLEVRDSPPLPSDAPLPDGRDGPALRLGLRLITGLGEAAGRAIEAARIERPFRAVADLSARTGLTREVLARLAKADALKALGPIPEEQGGWDRRQAQWAVQGLYDLPLFRGLARQEEAAPFAPPSPVEELEADYKSVGLSVLRHPIGLMRARLDRRGVRTARRLGDTPDGEVVRVAGLVTHRQRPGTASGMVFMTMEDETGMINLVVRPDLFERQRALIISENLLMVRGKVQRQGDALSVLAREFFPLSLGKELVTTSRDFR